MCFSIQWLMQLLVWCVIIGAIWAIIQVLLPYVLRGLSGVLGEAANIVIAVIRIVLWAIVAIAVIYIVFSLISCLLGMSGGFPSLAPHR